jgi:RNA polymerase sigma factor (sigma-70 family)
MSHRPDVVRYLDDEPREEDVTVTNAHPMDELFETHRGHLRAVAYRMLGSLSEAEDAVQEAWLRLHRAETAEVENLRGWLTTVVARVSLDMLRQRKARREEALEAQVAEPAVKAGPGANPEQEAVLADAVGVALLVVLDTLSPAERLAFVLHDMFAMPFDEIARITGRSSAAVRQLASRARRRVRGGASANATELREHRALAEAFLAALRAGNMEDLVAILDPDVVVRLDAFAGAPGTATGAAREIHGARTWAQSAIAFSRLARFTQPALLDGSVGLVFAPRGQLSRALRFEVAAGRISRVEVIADPARIKTLTVGVLK